MMARSTCPSRPPTLARLHPGACRRATLSLVPLLPLLLAGCSLFASPAERACAQARVARGEPIAEMRRAVPRGVLRIPDVPMLAGTGPEDTTVFATVVVRVLVDSLGRVPPGGVQVLEGDPDIAAAFVEAADSWSFEPAQLGAGCPAGDDLRYRFRLRRSPTGEMLEAVHAGPQATT